jgi:hypothetical protein
MSSRVRAIDYSQSPTREEPMSTHKVPDAFEARAGETYDEYADRIAALGSLGEPSMHASNPKARGADIDKRARELLAAAGIERPDYRQYRDAVCMAAAQQEAGKP